jgi:hypothetical protein
MKWEDERYVRLYTRDTTNWVMAPWESRAVFGEVLRKLDRAGVLDLNDDGLEGLAALIRMPLPLVEVGMTYWFKKKTFVLQGSVLMMPNYRGAQEAKASAKKRQQDARDRARDAEAERDDLFHPVTNRNEEPSSRDDSSRTVTIDNGRSHGVTPSLAEPSLAEPPSPLAPEGAEGEMDGKPSEMRLATRLPRSEARLWGKVWIERYEQAATAALGHPWAFDRKNLSMLEVVIDRFCTDKTRIEEWITFATTWFVRGTRDDDAKMWSAHQPKGLLRWLNEGGLRKSASASESPAVLAERKRREQAEREAVANRAEMPEALRSFARGRSPPPSPTPTPPKEGAA